MDFRTVARRGVIAACAVSVAFGGICSSGLSEVFAQKETGEEEEAEAVSLISTTAEVIAASEAVAAEDQADVSGLTAGVTSVITKTVSPTITLTAGIASSLTDYDSGEVYIVAQEKIKVAAAIAEEEYRAQVAADLATWGYENLGIVVTESNDVLNIRESGSESADIVGKLANHAAVEIIESDDEWVKIASGEVEGYVLGDYLVTGDEAYEIAVTEAETIATVTTSSNLRVRSEASTSSKILTNVSEGEELTVLSDEGNGWLHVSIDSTKGYVSADYVSVSEQLPTAQKVVSITSEYLDYDIDVSDVSETRIQLVETALQYVGNPYVWGGTSLTNGVDCSGFTMRIFAMFGVSLPHSSKSQPSYGTKISSSDARPGDLFFYGDGDTINHVAIYIGNGKIVHASTERTGIRISNAYYREPICVVSYFD